MLSSHFKDGETKSQQTKSLAHSHIRIGSFPNVSLLSMLYPLSRTQRARTSKQLQYIKGSFSLRKGKEFAKIGPVVWPKIMHSTFISTPSHTVRGVSILDIRLYRFLRHGLQIQILFKTVFSPQQGSGLVGRGKSWLTNEKWTKSFTSPNVLSLHVLGNPRLLRWQQATSALTLWIHLYHTIENNFFQALRTRSKWALLPVFSEG